MLYWSIYSILLVYGTDLADGEAVLVLSPADVERVVVLVEAALDRPRGDVAVAGRHPGQVAVLRSHQDLYSHGMKARQTVVVAFWGKWPPNAFIN